MDGLKHLNRTLLVQWHYKHYFSKILLLLIACFFSCPSWAFTPSNTAFYYGTNPPLNKLDQYPKVVFQPNSVNPQAFNSTNRTAFAYVSIGEIASLDEFTPAIPKNWIIGRNATWSSLVLDQSNPDWQKYFLDHIITPLWNKGFTGFFLDTLDSYQIANLTPTQQKLQEQGLVAIIQKIKQQYPQAKLILNRGFEILPQVRPLVDEVAAESLFGGWDNDKKQYTTVPESKRNDLIKQLNQVTQLGLPVTVIDYLPPDHPEKVREIANKISALGFSSWITNSDLTALYLSPELNQNVQPISSNDQIPRKILVFYQGKIDDVDNKVESMANTVVAMPLNYLGYVVILRNINEPLPEISKQEYAGIVMADIGRLLGRETELRQWYSQQIKKGIPIAILDDFGFTLTNNNLSPFNLSLPLFTHTSRSIKITQQSKMFGFETPPLPRASDFTPLKLKQGTSLMRATDELGVSADMAGITPWGGYALAPLVVQDLGITVGNTRWVINPFEFFKAALRLPNQPIPDTTTENGNRLLIAHIDGDSFANKGQWYNGGYVGDVLKDEIITRYHLATTVSIIEGELAPYGIYPKLSPDLVKIAREIFALPNVEIASHTFSHPFNWQKVPYQKENLPPKDRYNLPIPDYHFNLEREIAGSVNYINTYLAPSDKQCKVLLWSGDADLNEKALALTYQMGLYNFNGGDTNINKYENSITNIGPLGIFQGPYFQVYAPITNDFEFSNDGKKPQYSYVNAIDTFKLTDQPRRFKPIDIYNHFYVVQELGGIKALHIVYEWALRQDVMNVYASEYADKALDFNNLIIAKKDNGWLIRSNDKLRELRIPKDMGYPDLENSTNVIGYNAYNNDHYIHLGPGREALVRLTSQAPTIPYLVNANARVTYFNRDKNKINFSLAGYLPIKFTLGNAQNCTVNSSDKSIQGKMDQNHQESFQLEGTHYDFSVQCS